MIKKRIRIKKRRGGPWTVVRDKTLMKYELQELQGHIELKRLQAPSRGDFDPWDEVKEGGNMVKSKTNNKGKVMHGFWIKLKQEHNLEDIKKSGLGRLIGWRSENKEQIFKP